MTPQEYLVLCRTNFHRAVDLILDHLHSGNAEELASLYKEEMFRMPRGEMSIEQHDAGIDHILDAVKSDEEKMLIVRKLMVSSLHFSAFHYAHALQEATPVIGKELGEAYLEEAKEIRNSVRFFARMISDHLLRKHQHQNSEDM